MHLRNLSYLPAVQRLGRDLTPEAISEIRRYKEESEKAGPGQRREARASHKRKHWWSAFKVGASAAIYQATAATVGVSARDTELTFSAEKAWGNTSSISLWVAGAVAGLIPPSWRDTLASIIIPVEAGVSAFRMWVEQRLWRRYKITPDPAGTLLTPYLAGVMEFGYKAMTSYPQDPQSRLMVGLVGIYGNLIRLATAAFMFFLGKSAELKPEPKQERP